MNALIIKAVLKQSSLIYLESLISLTGNNATNRKN